MAIDRNRNPLLIEVAIEPMSGADGERLRTCLQTFEAQNAAFEVSFDAGSGQTILKGTSEVQIGAVVDALKRTAGVAFSVGAPQVAYRETLAKTVEIAFTHK